MKRSLCWCIRGNISEFTASISLRFKWRKKQNQTGFTEIRIFLTNGVLSNAYIPSEAKTLGFKVGSLHHSDNRLPAEENTFSRACCKRSCRRGQGRTLDADSVEHIIYEE